MRRYSFRLVVVAEIMTAGGWASAGTTKPKIDASCNNRSADWKHLSGAVSAALNAAMGPAQHRLKGLNQEIAKNVARTAKKAVIKCVDEDGKGHGHTDCYASPITISIGVRKFVGSYYTDPKYLPGLTRDLEEILFHELLHAADCQKRKRYIQSVEIHNLGMAIPDVVYSCHIALYKAVPRGPTDIRQLMIDRKIRPIKGQAFRQLASFGCNGLGTDDCKRLREYANICKTQTPLLVEQR